ncbi:MAG TPA: class I SAM-dependent methyltransferase [Blastocatellia bacterium]|nr:class I SAM-dependent methyltransferase [Blastocatellia bacterium]
MSAEEVKSRVRAFWESNPCGTKFADAEVGSREFFDAVEQHRYSTEWHIPQVVEFDKWRDRDVLEVGCGLGTDGVRFARAGARYTGIDLTNRSIELVQQRFAQEGLNGTIQVADAEQLPFARESFDLFYSHGVLHHTPDTQRAIEEAHRVLRPGGQAMVMLYHKRSYNYYVNIMALRRTGIRLLRYDWGPSFVHRLTGEDTARLEQFQRIYRTDRRQILDRDIFLNNNTDGVGNPLARVYTRAQVKGLFSSFRRVRTTVRFLNKKWIPLAGSLMPRFIEAPLAKVMGWHLWVIAEK